MKHLLKDLLFRLLILLPNPGEGASILMYHSVGTNAARFTVHPAEFERHLKHLVEHGYEVIRFSTLVARLVNGAAVDKVVCLTFDDGYADNYTEVLPLLERYGLPATIFITTGRIGETFTTSAGVTLPMLTDEQIREMQRSGLVEFLPHGHEHHNLDMLTDEGARSEILQSEQVLTELVGSVPKLYAYARGKYTTATLTLLKDLGYTAAATVRTGLVRNGQSRLLELPRNHIDSATRFPEFIARLGAAGERYEKLKLWNRKD